jgi:ElaB/YqjD/DUF883 family membrane-anchored ribosome-binding protein
VTVEDKGEEAEAIAVNRVDQGLDLDPSKIEEGGNMKLGRERGAIAGAGVEALAAERRKKMMKLFKAKVPVAARIHREEVDQKLQASETLLGGGAAEVGVRAGTGSQRLRRKVKGLLKDERSMIGNEKGEVFHRARALVEKERAATMKGTKGGPTLEAPVGIVAVV